jgi:hypothetical protein
MKPKSGSKWNQKVDLNETKNSLIDGDFLKDKQKLFKGPFIRTIFKFLSQQAKKLKTIDNYDGDWLEKNFNGKRIIEEYWTEFIDI